MAADFPNAIAAIARPSAGTKRNAPGYEGDVLHAKVADEIEAIEAVIGVTGSTVPTSIEYRLADVQVVAAVAAADVVIAQQSADAADSNAAKAAQYARAAQYAPAGVPSGNGQWFDILRRGVLTDWNADYGSGITVSLDTNITFKGQPTIRCDIAAGTSGFKNLCGVLTAIAQIPYGWDQKRIAIAMRTTNKALFTAISAFVGDSTLANNWAFTIPITTSYLATNYLQNNEWIYFRNIAAASVTGSPSVAQKMRAKLSATIVSQAQNESVWFGFFGVLPARKKPTIICCTDDGNAQNYTWLKDVLLHYDIPMSLSVNMGRIDSDPNNFMTTAQLLELQNHPSNLFDAVNHGFTPKEYNTYGAAATYADFQQNRTAMVAAGLPDLGSRIAVYPSGEFDDDLIKLLQAGGYYGARAVNYALTHTYDQLWAAGDKGAFIHAPCSFSDSAYTVSQMLTAVDTNTSNKGCSQLMFHRWGTSIGSNQWTYDMGFEIFSRLAAKRDAGEFELISYSRHLANIYGLHTDRR